MEKCIDVIKLMVLRSTIMIIPYWKLVQQGEILGLVILKTKFMYFSSELGELLILVVSYKLVL